MTDDAAGLVLAAVGVNGPEDGFLDWDAVDWRACEENVRRLRQRIFTASQSTTSPSGPFTVTVSNMPLGSSVGVHLVSTGSPDPRQRVHSGGGPWTDLGGCGLGDAPGRVVDLVAPGSAPGLRASTSR